LGAAAPCASVYLAHGVREIPAPRWWGLGSVRELALLMPHHALQTRSTTPHNEETGHEGVQGQPDLAQGRQPGVLF